MVRLDLDEKDFERLLEMTYLGNMVINSVQEESDKSYEAVEQAVFSKGKESGLSAFVDFAQDLNEYYPSASLEDKLFAYLDEYDNSIFWEMLSSKLAEKEMLEHHGTAKLSQMGEEELLSEREKIIERLYQEFEKHGLDKIQLKK